jgi:hypothetical protein
MAKMAIDPFAALRRVAGILVIAAYPYTGAQAGVAVSWATITSSLSVEAGEIAPSASAASGEMRTDVGSGAGSFLLYKLPDATTAADYLLGWRARSPEDVTDLYLAPDNFALPGADALQRCDFDCPGILMSSLFGDNHPTHMGFKQIHVGQIGANGQSVAGVLENHANSRYFAVPLANPSSLVLAAPEPGTLALLGVGALIAIFWRLRPRMPYR